MLNACRQSWFRAAIACGLVAVVSACTAPAPTTAPEQAGLDPAAETSPQVPDAATSARLIGERNAWGSTIVAAIERHWARPPGSPNDFLLIVHIEVLPTGQVASSNIEKTSGNVALDKSWLDAVARANPLPTAPEPGAYHRNLNITFSHHPRS